MPNEDLSPLRIPWPIRGIAWYYRRPLLGYLLLAGFGAVWALTPHGPDAAALIVLTLPWLLSGLAILTLPVLRAASRRFTAPIPVRRNHALEHGTIRMLGREYGTVKDLSGRAAPGGFRVAGAKNQEDIERAFVDFLALPHRERLALAVTDHCGSMLVFAQSLGTLLIFATLFIIAVWRLQPREAGILLGVQFFVFIFGRRPLGRFLQARRLLALDFPSARIKRIDRIEPRLFENPPVFFVHTEIEWKKDL